MAQAVLAQAGSDLLSKLGDAFLPGITSFVFSATDKVGFDLDTTGRARQTQFLEETARSTYNQHGCKVNIAVWNMHLDETHHFSDPILTTGLSRMGNGGGFRVVVFLGSGTFQNQGDGGAGNLLCSGADGIISDDGGSVTWEAIPEDLLPAGGDGAQDQGAEEEPATGGEPAAEGEGVAEGEQVAVEGEPAAESEPPAEVEPPAEGEPVAEGEPATESEPPAEGEPVAEGEQLAVEANPEEE